MRFGDFGCTHGQRRDQVVNHVRRTGDLQVLHPANVRIPGDVGAQVLRRLVGAVELLDLGPHVGVEALEVVGRGGAGEVQAVVLPDFDIVELPGALVDLHDRVQRQL